MNRFEYVRLRLTNIIITLEHGIDNDVYEQIGDSQSQWLTILMKHNYP